jgi:pimeloyl-ACP methyl ester carboxylesterase
MITGASNTWVTRDGVRLRVFHAGSGPLVVLLHGFPELAYSWRHQFEPLAAAGFTVAAPDQRGYGESDRPQPIEAYDIEQLAADAVAVIDHFGAASAVVIGHDWGAPVAWHAALRHPDRVRAVGSLSVPHARRGPALPTELMRSGSGDFIHYVDYFQQPGLVEPEFEADVRSAWLGFVWSISGDVPKEKKFRPIPKGARFRESFSTPDTLPQWLSENDVQTYVGAFEATGFTGGLNWYRNVDRNWRLTEDLKDANVSQPAFFVTGSRDPARNPAAMERLRNVVPDLRVSEVLEGCGHWTQQERPEETNRLLLSFLNGLPDPR